MTASVDTLCAWAEKQVRQRTGPTCAEMPAVARIADAIEGNSS